MDRFSRVVLLLTIVIVLGMPILCFPWPLPDTGQTNCYDNGGAVIPCTPPGEILHGQDAQYLINPPSYTKLDAEGTALPDSATSWVMVRDNVTGLIWEVKEKKDGVKDYDNPRDSDNTYTWYDPNPDTNGGDPGTAGINTDTYDFITALNNSKFGGRSDWRIPTVRELTSIRNLSGSSPGINTTYFPNTQQNYWSCTSGCNTAEYAWYVSYSGFTFSQSKASNSYVRAVRGDQSQSLNNLIDNADGTITDTTTGLMWQQETENKMSWQSALSYCEVFTLANYDDWRLPNEIELQSIVDYSKRDPSINVNLFNGAWSSQYLSSSTHTSTGYTWSVNFLEGNNFQVAKETSSGYVRAVRCGQNHLSGHLIIMTPFQGATWAVGQAKDITWDTQGIGGNVTIPICREGGRPNNFQTISASTENDGSYPWIVKDPASVNCVLRIEPASAPTKATTQGLFST